MVWLNENWLSLLGIGVSVTFGVIGLWWRTKRNQIKVKKSEDVRIRNQSKTEQDAHIKVKKSKNVNMDV